MKSSTSELGLNGLYMKRSFGKAKFHNVNVVRLSFIKRLGLFQTSNFSCAD